MTDWSHIGSTLRNTRESRSLTVHDVSHETRIPVKALHEIEEGDFSSFASPAYAKSFLGQYRQFLNLDCDDWLDDFELAAAKLDFDALTVLDFDDSEDAAEAPPAPRSRRAPAPAAAPVRPAGNSPALQPVAVFLATAMLLAAGIYGFIRLNDRLGDVATDEKPDSPPAAVTPASTRGQGQPPAPSPPLAANDSTPGGRTTGPAIPEDLDQPLVIEAQPPRAVIVEE